ncbi:hypothetical protein AX16_008379 [Volvariella volvacea WC 439]|nr:hypothetical protein AX16_008379 [Volvariella volvacea WC 439]
MFSPQCRFCSKVLVTSVRTGATISRLLLLCVICSTLTVPINVVVGLMPHFDIGFPFVLGLQCFNIAHVVVYLSVISYRYRKITQSLDSSSFDSNPPEGGQEVQFHYEYEPAYRILFGLPHIIIAYIDAVLWTISLGMALIIYEAEVYYVINPDKLRSGEGVNEEANIVCV